MSSLHRATGRTNARTIRVWLARAAAISASLVAMAGFALPGTAATESVLYNFEHPRYGEPLGRLLFHGGSLFGTGSGEGGCGVGQVFELTPSGGSWKESSRLKFDNTDGCLPFAGLVVDSHGIFYGTTAFGDAYGHGNVFGLQKTGVGWVHGTVWAFGEGGSLDGAFPSCDLIMDSSGNMYGTTQNGGTSAGIVFELALTSGGYTEQVLYNFTGGKDGGVPFGGLLMDKTGTLYGTTSAGGAVADCMGHGCGTVFALTPSGGGWIFSTLYTFTGGSDGAEPYGVLIEGGKGALYGTASNDDDYGSGNGNVFELTHSGGVWTEKVLYSFTGGSDGGDPSSGLTWDGSGGLYGTTQFGGAYGDSGTVFHLTESGGVWSETVLHSFGSGSDGQGPAYGTIILDKSGNLYGTTDGGGAYGNGTVWEVVP